MIQKPPGPKGQHCPFNGKCCSKVCATCPMWQHVRGTNPNTGEAVDRWDCSFAMLPMLLIENSQQTRQAGASVDMLRAVVADGRPYVAEVQQITTEPTRRLIR